MRILVLVGSPRKIGNTEMLADAFIRGARAAGAAVTKYALREKKIAPCRHCDYCQSHPDCLIRDDMGEVYDLLLHTDAVVFATPVYFYSMTAQLKALIDRLYHPLREQMPIGYTALLSVCADDSQAAFDPLRVTFAAIENYLHWTRVGEVTVTGLEAKGEIAGHAALEQARALGEQTAKAPCKPHVKKP